jgi:hypothetical protein
MVTIGLVIAAIVILGAVLLGVGMLVALWFGTQAVAPPDDPLAPGAPPERRPV